jgi:hypothetical protein
MLVAAAKAIATCTQPGDLVPHLLDQKVHNMVAEEVAKVSYLSVEKDLKIVLNEFAWLVIYSGRPKGSAHRMLGCKELAT